MTLDDVMAHFPTKSAACRAAGVMPSTWGHWIKKGAIPDKHQKTFERVTGGKLRAHTKSQNYVETKPCAENKQWAEFAPVPESVRADFLEEIAKSLHHMKNTINKTHTGLYSKKRETSNKNLYLAMQLIDAFAGKIDELSSKIEDNLSEE